jgi:hypothetical protein
MGTANCAIAMTYSWNDCLKTMSRNLEEHPLRFGSDAING